MRRILSGILVYVCFITLHTSAGLPPAEPLKSFKPGQLWPDTDGVHINAHGGGILVHEDTYYWFGEQRAQTLPRNQRAVSCYCSKDLVHWTFRGDVFTADVIDTWIWYKMTNEVQAMQLRPHPYEFCLYADI